MLKRFILVFAAVVTMTALHAQDNQTQVVDKVIAVVGKNVILQSDIENQYMQYRLQGGVQGSGRSVRCEILEDLMFQKLMLNQAEMDSLTVTDDEVEAEMSRRINYFISQLGSQEKMESYFNKTLSEIKDELRRAVKDGMLQEQVQRDIMKDVEVTPAEVRAFYRSVPQDSLPMVSEEFEIAQIVKSPPVSVDEKLEVKDKLYKLRRRILDGESFSTLAIMYSEDPGSAKNGGELGFFTHGDMVPEFESTAFNLREGEISEVVETEYGFHIIQLIERRDDYINCRHILLTAKVPVEALEKAQHELDSAAQMIRNGDMTFEEACTLFSDDDSKNNGGNLVNAASGGYRLSLQDLQELEMYYKEYKNISFVISRLGENEVSDPVPMTTNDNTDGFRIILVKKRFPAHKANLTDDYWRIQGWALGQKKQQAIDKWINAKSKKAFIRIDEDFSDCDFKFNWK